MVDERNRRSLEEEDLQLIGGAWKLIYDKWQRRFEISSKLKYLI